MGVVLLVTWMIQSFIFQFQTLVWSKTMSQITKSCSRKHIRGNDIMWIHLVTQALNICGPAAVFVFVWYLAIRSGGSNQWELEETRNSAWVQSGRLPLHSPLSLLPPFTWCGRVFMFSLSPFKPTRFCLEHYHPITSLPTNLDLLFSLLSDVFGHSCDPPSTLQPILLQLFIIPPHIWEALFACRLVSAEQACVQYFKHCCNDIKDSWWKAMKKWGWMMTLLYNFFSALLADIFFYIYFLMLFLLFSEF